MDKENKVVFPFALRPLKEESLRFANQKMKDFEEDAKEKEIIEIYLEWLVNKQKDS